MIIIRRMKTVWSNKHSWRLFSDRSNNNVYSQLHERGFIQSIYPENSDSFIQHLNEKKRTIYAGFDPTADGLHIGNLLILKAMMHFKLCGHDVVALVGGATARIGDPSGRSTERNAMSPNVVKDNSKSIKQEIGAIWNKFEEITGCHNTGGFEIIDNMAWYENLNMLDFLAETGRHFRVNKMLKKKYIKSRLEKDENGLSLNEFLYETFQSYDWRYLFHNRNCTVQLGGSDQMGNIASGHALIDCDRAFGLTLPLITSEDGSKLGKSAGVTIWLNVIKTTPFDFYQYFLRTTDRDVEKMLKLFTFLPLTEIEDAIRKHRKYPDKRHAQKKLAEQITLLVHGESGLATALTTTKLLYGSQDNLKMMSQMNADKLKEVFTQAGYSRLLFEEGLSILDMAMKIGCFRTERDAIRVIDEGGFYVNQIRRQNTEEILVPGIHVMSNGLTLARVGKKHYYIIEWTF